MSLRGHHLRLARPGLPPGIVRNLICLALASGSVGSVFPQGTIVGFGEEPPDKESTTGKTPKTDGKPDTEENEPSAVKVQQWISPQADAEFPPDGNIVVRFNAPVQKGEGQIRVIDLDQGDNETFAATDSRVVVEGNFLTVHPPFAPTSAGKPPLSSLKPGTRYALQILEGAVLDREKNPCQRFTLEFATGEGGLNTEIVELKNAWVTDRNLGGTSGEEVRVEGLDNLAKQFFDSAWDPSPRAGAMLHVDTARNAFIIHDTPDRIRAFREFIAEFDQPPQLVEISVAIIDVTASAGFEWESELLVRGGKVNGVGAINTTDSETTFASTLGGASDVKSRTIADPPPFLSGSGFTLNSLIKATRGDSLQIQAGFTALESRGDAQILSRPAALTVDNRQVSLKDDQTFHVRVPGLYRPRLFPVTTGTDIRVLPHVIQLDDGSRAVRLAVWISNGGTSDSFTSDDIPAVSYTKISTQAVIRENESLLVAGNYRHSEGRDESFVPIVGKIPVIGLPFKDKLVTQSKSQRMFLITPKVIDADSETLSHRDARVGRMLDEADRHEAGLRLNQANEAQVQGALSPLEATGEPRFTLLPKLRRAWHTNQNP